jgi:hypothetical protein
VICFKCGWFGHGFSLHYRDIKYVSLHPMRL